MIEEGEFCVPTVEESCEDVELENDILGEEEKCVQVTRTECREEIEQVQNELCGYTYESRTESAFIKSIDVDYEKTQRKEHVEVCRQTYGYGKKCEEVKQKVKQNKPHVSSKNKRIEIQFPEALKKCLSRRLFLPRIVCEDKTTEKCFKVPTVQKELITLQVCRVNTAEPKCENKKFDLPKIKCEQPPEVKEAEKKPEPVEEKKPEPSYEEPAEEKQPETSYEQPAEKKPEPSYKQPEE